MIITACLMLALLELITMVMLILPYTKKMDVDLFITNAPLEKILQVRLHFGMAAALFTMATILAAGRAGKFFS